MKTIQILCLLFILQFVTYSQVIVTTPEFPSENDSIVVIFDATQPGGEELLNNTGTLYAHTGVNTNLGTWQHVKGDWGNNQTQPALTPLGSNQYKLTIGRPRQFYNITNITERIQQISLVIRNSAGSRQTRPDIFIDLYEPGLTVVVKKPAFSNLFNNPLRSPVFEDLDDTTNIEIAAAQIGTKISSLSLYVNNVETAESDSGRLYYNLIAANSDEINYIKAVGIDTAGIVDSVSFVVVVNPSVETAAVPEGIENGINYTGSTSVTLNLYAPEKKFVYVIGDFNNWEVNPSYYMKRSPDSSEYWVEINNLQAGKEYIFQYLVDGELRIADPYADKVSDPWNDGTVNNKGTVYPNLIPYPDGKTSEIASVLQTDQAEYQWEVTNFVRPDQTKLVIYELLLRDFLSTHSYSTLADTLGYLKRLGVNAIEIMPPNEFEGNESWGYNVSFHFAPDKYYGTKNDLKKFIDECHKQGIAVIFDMVLNHMYGQSSLVRLYWNASQSRPAANSPWFNQVSPNPVFSFGYDFNHEKQATKDYVDRVNRYWLEEYKFDGYRFDFTKGFTNTLGDGSGFDQSRINILKRMADQVWNYDSSAYVILEHFAPNSEEKILADYGMMLWGNMNHQYNEATMGYASDLTGITHIVRGFNSPNLVGYMESHDEERLMYKNLQFGKSDTSGYNTKNLSVALNRMKLAAAFFFPIAGPKMIWQFGELGYDVSIDFNGRTGNKPIRWNYYQDPERNKLYKTYAALIGLKDYEAFQSASYTVRLSGFGKRININHPTMNVTIIGNFDVKALNVDPGFQQTGTWYDYFSGDSIIVSNAQASIPLQPGEFHIYTTVKLPPPEPGLITDVETLPENVAQQYSLEQNYPNPFNPTTNFEFRISDLGLVTIKVFDILGKEVATVVNEELSPGVYNINFDASNLSSGVYFYTLNAGNYKSTKKMILLR